MTLDDLRQSRAAIARLLGDPPAIPGALICHPAVSDDLVTRAADQMGLPAMVNRHTPRGIAMLTTTSCPESTVFTCRTIAEARRILEALESGDTIRLQNVLNGLCPEGE